MKTTILVRTDKGKGWRTPRTQSYTNEDELRTLLQGAPELLPGLDASRPVVLVHEVPVTYGFIDLVGVSPSGALTVVECKLHYNPDMKRTIVGQLFAYAAGLWGMSYAEFDEAWQATSQPFNMNLEQWEARKRRPLIDEMEAAITEHGLAWDRDGFEAAVEANLAAGRYTLVFAVDDITPELKRIVEYLSEHRAPEVNVIALEIEHLTDGETEVLLPQAYGQEMAQLKVASAGAGVPLAPDEPSFMAELRMTAGDWAEPIVRSLLDWAGTRDLVVWYGAGRKVGTMNFGIIDGGGARRGVVVLWSSGAVYLQFDQLKHLPPFDSLEVRQELLGRINAIDGVHIPERMAGSWPTVPYALLRPDVSLRTFRDAFDWALGLVVAEAGRQATEHR